MYIILEYILIESKIKFNKIFVKLKKWNVLIMLY